MEILYEQQSNESGAVYTLEIAKGSGLNKKSRMRGDSHVRFCESPEGKFLRATRLSARNSSVENSVQGSVESSVESAIQGLENINNSVQFEPIRIVQNDFIGLDFTLNLKVNLSGSTHEVTPEVTPQVAPEVILEKTVNDSVESSVQNQASSVQTPDGSVEKSAKKVVGADSISARKSSVEILNLLSENPEMTAKELAEQIGVTCRTVEKNLKKLQLSGQLKRIGPKKSGHWEVVCAF